MERRMFSLTVTDGASNTMAGFYNPTTYALANSKSIWYFDYNRPRERNLA